MRPVRRRTGADLRTALEPIPLPDDRLAEAVVDLRQVQRHAAQAAAARRAAEHLHAVRGAWPKPSKKHATVQTAADLARRGFHSRQIPSRSAAGAASAVRWTTCCRMQ